MTRCTRRGRRRAMRQKVHRIARRGRPPPWTRSVGDCAATATSCDTTKRWRRAPLPAEPASPHARPMPRRAPLPAPPASPPPRSLKQQPPTSVLAGPARRRQPRITFSDPDGRRCRKGIARRGRQGRRYAQARRCEDAGAQEEERDLRRLAPATCRRCGQRRNRRVSRKKRRKQRIGSALGACCSRTVMGAGLGWEWIWIGPGPV